MGKMLGMTVLPLQCRHFLFDQGDAKLSKTIVYQKKQLLKNYEQKI